MDKFNPDVRAYIKKVEDDVESKRNALERNGKTDVEYAVIRGQIKGMRMALSHIDGDHEDDDPSS